MYQGQSDIIQGLEEHEYEILREMCRWANNLYNHTLYNIRQHYFAEKKYLSYKNNYHVCKLNENYKLLHANIAQQTVMRVHHHYSGYFESFKKARRGEYDINAVQKPYYREKGSLYPLIIPSSAVIIKDGKLQLPMSKAFMKQNPGVRIFLPIPERLANETLLEVTIVPVYDGHTFKIQYGYKIETEDLSLNRDNAMGIDIGVNNMATCVSTNGTSLIMDGRKIKSINQHWNKRIAKLSSVAAKQGTKRTRQICDITLKRNNRCHDIILKTARHIINHCIENDIGTIVVGYNKNMKHEINLGTKTNQQFTQIAFGDLRGQLKHLCKRYGMVYEENEESYTSKASFLDNDFIPVYNAKDKGSHTFSGKRTKRGLYRSKDGHRINADTNAACNILRKSNRNIENLPFEVIATPQRIRVD